MRTTLHLGTIRGLPQTQGGLFQSHEISKLAPALLEELRGKPDPINSAM